MPGSANILQKTATAYSNPRLPAVSHSKPARYRRQAVNVLLQAAPQSARLKKLETENDDVRNPAATVDL